MHAIPLRSAFVHWAFLLLTLLVAAVVAPAHAQIIPPAEPPGLDEGSSQVPKVKVPPKKPEPKPAKKPEAEVLEPFGAKLFMGNFLGVREDGLNPDYIILNGDRVAVYSWGTVDIRQTFVVDGQGNIFLPGVGPVHLAGIRNADLTAAVRKGMERVYTKGFEVYTNLITASPVGVYVTGGVERPGRYAGIPSDSLLFFLDQAGGIDPQLGSYRKISVLRQGVEQAKVDLYAFLLEGKLPPLQFEEGDTILVHQRGIVVELRGDVATPSLLEFPEEPVSGADVLAIIPGGARATQVTLEGVRDSMPFTRTLSVADFAKAKVRGGDAVHLRADGVPDTIVVRLEGEYKGPSAIAVRRGARLVDVLNYIPVDREIANVGAVHVRRQSVARDQKDSIDDSLFRLERSALLALSQSNGESNIRVKEAELTLQFVERARLIQPLGRVVTAHNGVQQNLLLESEDVIVIPPRTNVVRISGEVMLAQAVVHRPGATAEDYIRDAGGYTDRGDDDKVILIRPNAEVTIGDTDLAVGPGDEVLVPPRVDTKYLQNFSDVTTVIYQIAVSAAVILALAL